MAASKKEEPIIEVKHLSKQYIIGVDKTYKTLCDSLTSAVKNPLKTLTGCHRPNDTFWALKDVNFEVERGEIVGIIGRNGAGKSTLLKVLSRITHPTEGEVHLRGRVGSLLEVGTGFHPELTGRENIYFNGAILGMKKREIDDKFDDIVKFSDVEKFLDTPVKRYSSGMQVRLAFSVAANLDPEILVIDEVLAVGDASFQKKCLGKMEEVAEGGRTVLFVSHNMGAIKQLTQKSILISEGRLISYGLTEEIVNEYLKNEATSILKEYTITDKHRQNNSLSRDVEFRSVKLGNDKNTNIVSKEENLHFHLTVFGNKNVKNFRFSLTIFQVDGTPVGSVFGPQSHSIAEGEVVTYEMKLCNLNLAPGTYYCALATGKGNNQVGHIDFDIIINVLYFEVLPQVNSDGVRSQWTSGWGSIIFEEPEINILT